MKCALLTVAMMACGGASSLSPDEVVGRLRAVPGVTVEERATAAEDYHYYVVHFTQPIDHDNPELGTFQQEVSLLHRDTTDGAPMIVSTTGYSDYTLDSQAELTKLLAGNQVSIEHRYFGESRPAAPVDWTKLTIAQAAADEHAIIAALRTVYDGAFVTTGASKGGMTAVFHRSFYPDDVEGTVPYVAPISFGAPDLRYNDFLAEIGPADCRQAVRDIAVEMLANRRAAMRAGAAALTGKTYARVSLDAELEEAILALEWTFWQYTGVTGCAGVPKVTDDDSTLSAFLLQVSPPNSDADNTFFEAYVYQAYAQLGYPQGGTDFLQPYTQFHDADYNGELPTTTTKPAYDAAAMQQVDQFVQREGDRLLLLYGGWDPWTGGEFRLGAATNSAIYVVDQGTHGSKLTGLAGPDRDAAFAQIEAWTGVAPDLTRLQSKDPHQPRSVEPMPRLRRLGGR